MGDNICMRSGFKVRPGDLVKERKTGLWVAYWEVDPVHPQDHVRGKPERPTPDLSPEPADNFLTDNQITADML